MDPTRRSLFFAYNRHLRKIGAGAPNTREDRRNKRKLLLFRKSACKQVATFYDFWLGVRATGLPVVKADGDLIYAEDVASALMDIIASIARDDMRTATRLAIAMDLSRSLPDQDDDDD